MADSALYRDFCVDVPVDRRSRETGFHDIFPILQGRRVCGISRHADCRMFSDAGTAAVEFQYSIHDRSGGLLADRYKPE